MISSCVGQFHEDLGKFLTWLDDVNSNLQSAPPPGVEPPEVENKMTKLEVLVTAKKGLSILLAFRQ